MHPGELRRIPLIGPGPRWAGSRVAFLEATLTVPVGWHVSGERARGAVACLIHSRRAKTIPELGGISRSTSVFLAAVARLPCLASAEHKRLGLPPAKGSPKTVVEHRDSKIRRPLTYPTSSNASPATSVGRNHGWRSFKLCWAESAKER